MNSEDGSILLLDMLGGHAGETTIKLPRQNDISGKLNGHCEDYKHQAESSDGNI